MSSSGFREACDPHRSMGVQLGLRLTMACDHSFWTHEEWLCDIDCPGPNVCAKNTDSQVLTISHTCVMVGKSLASLYLSVLIYIIGYVCISLRCNSFFCNNDSMNLCL